MSAVVVEVVVDVRSRALDRTFDYFVPDVWADVIQPGHRVFVSFGKQYRQAYVIRKREADSAQGLKPVLELLDEFPVLPPTLLALCDWVRQRYGCTWVDAIQAALPAAFRMQQRRVYAWSGGAQWEPGDAVEEKVWRVLRGGPLSFHQLTARCGADAAWVLERWIRTGLVREQVAHKDQTGAQTEFVLRPVVDAAALCDALAARRQRAPRQASVLAQLLDAGELPLKAVGMRPSSPAVQALRQAGLVAVAERQVHRSPQPMVTEDRTREQPLTVWQARALDQIRDAIAANRPSTVVVHGVTGSGKTELYMRALDIVLQRGGNAIVLVPEIALTPQLVGRFTARFGQRVAVLHSALSNGEKRDEWLRIRRGDADIVIGARSAVFAPVRSLQLIIIDEEHEPSYKQDETPRYDARDVAEQRAQAEGAVLVCGSATPSLRALERVAAGEARLATLPQRANGQPLPPVLVVDMREELKAGNRSLFSRALLSGLEEAVAAGRQAILFLNRRGYASFLLCRACGQVPECPNCDISLTLHRGRHGDWLRCHYCGYTENHSETCPACGELALRPHGVGTQQVEQVLHEQFPDWRLLRMDVDTTRRKGMHQSIVSQFLNGAADVLIGTQMVAKGLDFPNVSFVGVISADTMLAVPDYRASERTFQLLTQVAGRAGRADVPGRTVVQTYQPDHYAITAAARHDFNTFYQTERRLREAFGYPPFCELAVFMASHRERSYAEGLPADLSGNCAGARTQTRS
ncbi:primosomal protein N' [Alicyclobacillus contaminans]|nr:primosomal protein N' [Alicyclobacillus contaminans]